MKIKKQLLKSLLILKVTLIVAAPLASGAATPEDHESSVRKTTETQNARLTDPTQPNWFGLSKAKKKSTDLVLNSLVRGSQRRIAVINGELMREGDSRRGITVDQILEDRVLITTAAGTKRVLKLEKVKHTAKTPRETARGTARGTTR